MTSSSRNTPWLLLFLLRIMMMLPLIINSYNLVSFHHNLMKLVLNLRISHCLSFPGNIFLFFPFFWKNLFLVRLWTWKTFSPDSIRVNFEVLKLLHLCMDCHEVCFKWWSKGVFMILRRWIFEFYFCSYAWMSLTYSRSFPRGVASGGLHLFHTMLRLTTNCIIIEVFGRVN